MVEIYQYTNQIFNKSNYDYQRSIAYDIGFINIQLLSCAVQKVISQGNYSDFAVIALFYLKKQTYVL